MAHRELIAGTPAGLRAAEAIAGHWDALGIDGHLLARDLATGAELGFDVERATPLASVAKVPIALVVLDAIARGELAGDRELALRPAANARGTVGVAAFRHPARIAVADLVMLMITVSDNAAADHLLGVLPPARVDAALRGWGHPGVRIRHAMQPLHDAAVDAAGEDAELALELAIAAERTGVHAIGMLDPERANSASARALVGLLDAVWSDAVADPRATAELRRLMRGQVYRHRLAAELSVDGVTVAGKTGTFLHLRHEIGVVESASGGRVAIAALTRTARRAAHAADVDLAIGAAARIAFETLRDSRGR